MIVTMAVLTVLAVVLCLDQMRLVRARLTRMQDYLESLGHTLQGLQKENARLKEENARAGKELEETLALYEFTKEIARSLDEQKVFAYFKERVCLSVGITDCAFVRSEAEPVPFKKQVVFPVSAGRKIFGYLVAGGVEEHNRQKFSIVAHQCILAMKRAHLYQKVQESAITDSLTGTFTRRYFMERCREEWERSRQFSHCFSLLMADVDNFKSHNDTYGHLVGDVILKEVARIMKDTIRAVDSIGRYGGEEFIVTLIETDMEEARYAAERIRAAVEGTRIKAYDEELAVTVSIGIAAYPRDSNIIEALIEKADKALYRAKNGGRNRVST